MNRRERKGQFLTLERRVLAGERKADIVGQAAADGEDWRALARVVSQIPTPTNRRRWRWLNRLLMAALVAAAAGQLAAARLVEGDWFWLALQLMWTVYFVLPLASVARYRPRGYSVAMATGVFALAYWFFVVARGDEYAASGALVAAEAALCTLALVLTLVAERLLLPATTMWTEVRPKLDAAGNLRFEE
jgi:hypothetical protein